MDPILFHISNLVSLLHYNFILTLDGLMHACVVNLSKYGFYFRCSPRMGALLPI